MAVAISTKSVDVRISSTKPTAEAEQQGNAGKQRSRRFGLQPVLPFSTYDQTSKVLAKESHSYSRSQTRQ